MDSGRYKSNRRRIEIKSNFKVRIEPIDATVTLIICCATKAIDFPDDERKDDERDIELTNCSLSELIQSLNKRFSIVETLEVAIEKVASPNDGRVTKTK